MSARDMANAISHGDHGETKGDGYTKESDVSKDCCTATTENKNECAEEFGEEFVTDFHRIKFLMSYKFDKSKCKRTK